MAKHRWGDPAYRLGPRSAADQNDAADLHAVLHQRLQAVG
jgi:hypothetical protein